MNYALNFSLVKEEAVTVIGWEEDKRGSKFSLNTPRERLQFLRETVKSGDRVYLLSGGISREVATFLAKRGIEVAIVPASKIGKRTTSLQIAKKAREEPEAFNIWHPEETSILELRSLLKKWQEMVEERKAVGNRLTSAFYAQVLQNPEEYFEKTASDLSRLAKSFRDKNPLYAMLCSQEQETKRVLVQLVTEMPLYQEVFSLIEGCGPLIAARIIAYTRRIDRFPNAAAYATYCGFGLRIDPNGEVHRQRRRKGESSGRHEGLYYTIRYLLIEQQFRRFKRGKWAEFLQQRILHEMEKKEKGLSTNPNDTPTGRAIWWIGNRFCREIYKKWKEFEAA